MDDDTPYTVCCITQTGNTAGSKAAQQAVGHHSPEGGDAYADYSDISCVRNYRNTEIDEEKQQPPLGQVTVAM